MKYILYRSRLSYRSGTGQLIAMHYKELSHRGSVQIYGKSKLLNFFFSTGIIPRKASVINGELFLKERNRFFIIDHDSSLKNSDLSFVHNVQYEKFYDNSLDFIYPGENLAAKKIVANSNMVKDILIASHGAREESVFVVYPGYDNSRFNEHAKNKYRELARSKIGANGSTVVIGFITSGNLYKRGFDTFLNVCSRFTGEEFIFFVLGGDGIPDEYKEHEIVKSKRFVYKEKCHNPEYWLSALDIFLYTARFEEFGMVVPEAMAMGIPVITSKYVGASELMHSSSYQTIIVDKPSVESFVLSLESIVKDKDLYSHLVNEGLEAVKYNDLSYSSRTLSVIEGCLKNQ